MNHYKNDTTNNIKWLLFRFSLSKKTRIITRAITCRGYTDNKKLSRLYDLVQQTKNVIGDIVEIGSAWGRSTVLFGLSTRKKIFSIDPHTGAENDVKEDFDSYPEFLLNINRFHLDNRVKSFKATTQEISDLKLLPDNILASLIFIDGLHTSEGIKIDLNFSLPLLSPGGIMVFDDFFEPSVMDYSNEIVHFVNEIKVDLVRDTECKLVWFINSI